MPQQPSAGPSRRTVLTGAGLALGAGALLRPSTAPAATSGSWDVGVLGDSISANGSLGSAWDVRTGGRNVFGDLSYLGYALPLTCGRFRFAGTWASVGLTSDDIVAQHLPKALAARPKVLAVLVGTNDIGRLPIERTQANIRSIVAALRRVGTLPVLGTIPPGDFYTAPQLAQAKAFNTWIWTWARANGVRLIDYNAALRQATPTRPWKPGLSSDGGHPSAAGAQVMGRLLAGVLVKIPGPTATPLLRDYSPRALIADPLHSHPGTWTLAGQRSSGTYSHLASTAWVGAKAVIRSRPYADFQVIGRLTSQPVPGHRLRFATLVEARQVPAGGRWTCLLIDRSYNLPLAGYAQMTRPIANANGTTAMSWEFVMPPLLPGSDVVVQWAVQGSADTTLGLAQTTLLDLGPA